ncbi:pleckstrin homology domain-containing family M member 3 [Pholidichthys leucotaenia]
MDGLEQLDMVGDISPALEATEDFIHCMDRVQGQGPSQPQSVNHQPPWQPKQLQEVSSDALGKLSSSGVWSLLAGEQPEVGPLGLAWADNFSVLGLGMGLRHGKRSRARSTNDLAAHTKEYTNNVANSSSNSAFKKGHNRSRSDVNYHPSAYTDNGLPAVDCNTLKNMILNHQQEADKSSSSSSVVKQGEMEQREGSRGRWTSCHVELTPCELRLYTLDSSANRQLGTAYSLSHCQSIVSLAPCSQPSQITQPADQRTLQAVFFNSTRLQLRAATQWEAMEWRRLMWEKVQAVRPMRQENRQKKTGVESQQVSKFPAPMSPSSSPSPSGLDTQPDGESDTPTSAEASLSLQPSVLSRPTTLPLFTQHCQDVLKAGVLHQLTDQNNWRPFTFVLTRSALQAFPTEGRGPVSHPVTQHSLVSCLSVQHDQESENGEQWSNRGHFFQAVFPTEVLRLRADDPVKAQEWVEALRETIGAQKPAQEEGREPEVPPSLQGVLLRSKPLRDRRQRDAQRAKRQSVTTSFLSILTCLAVEKGLTAQSFRCAGCQRPVGLSRGKAKVCYYSGWYYCQSCHQDNSFLIPARLLHNWDTSKHKVSKQAKEFLEFVYEEPLLDIQQLNPCLYEHCEPLSTVLRLRQQLQSLRAYLFSCRATVAEDLRRRIFPREYLLQHIHLYSLADLQQVIDGKLAPFLSKVIKFASSHVFSCSLCREKGFICELCHNRQVIYPFQENATRRCEGCGAVFHADCRQKAQPCPRCVRRELHHKRPSSFWSPDDDSPGCYHLPYQDT